MHVTLGLVSGQNRVGYLKKFDPAASDLLLICPRKNAEGRAVDVELALPAHDLCFVAFHKEVGEDDGHVEERDDRPDFCVHLPGSRKFVVTADPDAVDRKPGFFADPISQFSWFERIFFYAHGINAVEDMAPLGSLLVAAGVVPPDAIKDGLREQAALQNTPVGQILVEQEAVTSEAVEEAATLQEQSAAEAEKNPRSNRRLRLGEVLVDAGLATEQDIEDALAEQKRRRGMRLGQVLVEMGIVSEREISETLAKKFNLEFVDLNDRKINPEAADEVPLDIIERFELVPLSTSDTELVLAMADPLEMEPLDLLRFSLGKKIREVVATPSQIERLSHHYIEQRARDERAAELESILKELHAEAERHVRTSDADVRLDDTQDGAIVRMVNQIIIDAFRRDASDIHIEPNGEEAPVQVRFRIDGVCETYREIPAAHRAPLVARIKIMANLDITERRKPQDGKIKVQVGSRKLELRVATVPTVNRDEDVVLRILASGDAMPLEQLSFSDENLRELRKAVQTPYGLILAVGPTGSGKTTTLHALLGSINNVERKIWTAEDPVEITQAGLRQVQVHPDIGFTFANALRSFLRADPDVIMVGEMRDKETATIGPETVTRLVDMGLDPFSFADALVAVVAQRLARRLCVSCREKYEASDDERNEIAELLGEDRLAERLDGRPLTLWRAKGCSLCDHKGYRGRVGIHELLLTSEELRQAIYRRQSVDDIRRVARETGMRTLIEDGVEKCLDGITDLSQILAVCSR
jgi:type II secretory ATPase GspE/PulE/Tfp pilus assembly ATPase PilB-like protein